VFQTRHRQTRPLTGAYAVLFAGGMLSTFFAATSLVRVRLPSIVALV